MRVKTLWLRQPYLAQILAGTKTVEVRVGYDNVRRLQPGDRLRLNDRHLAEIRRVTLYDDFEALVAAEDAGAIAPGLPPGEMLPALRELYGPEKEALGAVALEISLCRYDAVLFDMGYTLVYFYPVQEKIVQEALQAIGAERSVDQIRQLAGMRALMAKPSGEIIETPPAEHGAAGRDGLAFGSGDLAGL